MSLLPNTKRALERLDHVNGHLEARFNVKKLTESVNDITDFTLHRDRGALVSGLRSYCTAKAMSEWYSTGDVIRVKNLFYSLGKLAYIGLIENWTSDAYRMYTFGHILYSMPIFICDHPDLIQWCINSNYGLREGKNRDKPHSYEFHVKNVFLAMHQQWNDLEERTRQYIANPRPRPYSRLDIFEFEFLLGLATGDVPKMEAAISEFVTAKGLRTNSANETGFTDGLISTSGLLFAKLAWRNGYEVNVDSPYIPKEWLPVQPLEHYEDEFDFMRAYTIDPTWGDKFA